MKIALLASTFLPRIGGAELAVHNLALHLLRLGHEVTVITWWGLWQQSRHSVPYSVLPLLPRSFTHADRSRQKSGRLYFNRVVPQLLYYQWRHQFDIWNIHHAFPLGILACRDLARRGLPVVVTAHGDDVLHDLEDRYNLLHSTRIKNLMGISLCGAHRVVAISPVMRAAIEEFGVPREKIADIPNGVNVGSFSSRENRRMETRRLYRLPLDVPLILSIGRNHVQKGYDLIPATMSELMHRDAHCLWVVVGQDSELILKGVTIDLATRIRCLPPILEQNLSQSGYNHLPSESLVDLYQACDIYVLPSRVESFGIVVAEALAAGLPVVGTTGMGAPDMVTKGKGGFVVEKNNPEALADKIEILLRDNSLRERMGQYNREKAKQYDWEVVTRQYVACFEEAITAARGR